MLEIWAPNLLSLEISGCFYATCSLHVPSLTSATLGFEESCEMSEEDFPPLEMFDKIFRSISHAEKVTLSNLSIQLLLKIVEDMIMFPNTKFLKLYTGQGNQMLDVLVMFPQLMMLVVELQEDYYYFLESDATFPIPSLHHLKTVEISWYVRDASILPAIEILLHNAHVLEKMVLQSNYKLRYDRELWLKAKEKVLSMPRSSATAKIIAIE